MKCHVKKCCQLLRSFYFDVISDGFLPPPIPVCQSLTGLKIPEPSQTDLYILPSIFFSLAFDLDSMLPRSAWACKIFPYDLHCPSFQSSVLEANMQSAIVCCLTDYVESCRTVENVIFSFINYHVLRFQKLLLGQTMWLP